MDDAVRDCLRDVIARHGVAVTREPQRLEALLADLCPGHDAEAFLLGTALRKGVVDDLRRPGSALPVDAVAAQLVQRLTRLGLTAEAARWSVESWIAALPGLPPLGARTAPAPATPTPARRTSSAPSTRQAHVLHHPAPVRQLLFRPDGQMLITRAGDTVRGWSTASGREQYAVRHGGSVNHVALSPDGLWLATAGADQQTRTMRTDDGVDHGRFTHKSAVTCVCFGPAGHLAAGTDDENVKVWHPDGRAADLSCESSVRRMAFRPDGAWLATLGEYGEVQLWVVTTGKARDTDLSVGVDDPDTASIAFSPDGEWLAATGDDLSAVWNTLTWEDICPSVSAGGGLDWDPVSGRYAVSDGSGAIVLRTGSNRGGGVRVDHGATEHGDVRSVAFSPDGRWLATGSEDTTARVWDASSRRETARFRHGDTVSGVAFSPDGTLLATASLDATVRLWRL